MTTLVATSVVRGSHQGESHGGVYLIALDDDTVRRTIDWNTADIDWQGRGWDRGLRGIAFDGDRVFIAASDELFEFAPDFKLIDSHRNQYLKHCHEIFCYKRRLYMCSTGFDSILGFDLDRQVFTFGLHILSDREGFRGQPFDPVSANGPGMTNNLHINSVYCTDKGMYISGLRTGGVLFFNGRTIKRWVNLPQGVHNARPFKDGVLFNDTQADVIRFVAPGTNWGFHVPKFDPDQLTHTDLDDSRIARQGFGRGLCVIDDRVIAGGSSPSTIALHDIDRRKSFKLINLTMDIRNAIHGLEVWPFA